MMRDQSIARWDRGLFEFDSVLLEKFGVMPAVLRRSFFT